MKPDSKTLTPQAQLRASIAKLEPKTQKLFRSVRAAVRKRFPTANELSDHQIGWCEEAATPEAVEVTARFEEATWSQVGIIHDVV